MAWNDLKAAVAAVIKTNGNQEITGALLQSTLNSIIDQVGANASYKGVAIPSTNPGTPDALVFYIASTQGTYANFGGFVLDGGFAVLSNVSGSWAGTKFLKTELDAKANQTELDQLAGEVSQITKSQAIQLLRLHNPALVFSGFVDVNSSMPAHSANKAYIATASGTVLGLAGVVKGQVIIDNGISFHSDTINNNNGYFSKKGFYIRERGEEVTNSFLECTEYILLDVENPIVIYGRATDTAPIISYFNASKQLISNIIDTSYTGKYSIILPEQFPEGAEYVRANALLNTGDFLNLGFIGIGRIIDKLINDTGDLFIIKNTYLGSTGQPIYHTAITGCITNFIPISVEHSYRLIDVFDNGTQVACCFYNDSFEFIAKYNTAISRTQGIILNPSDFPEYTRYIRCGKVTEITNAKIIQYPNAIQESLNGIIEADRNLIMNPFTINGYVHKDTGDFVSTTELRCTDFIPIKQSDVVILHEVINNGSYVKAAVFYDSSKNYISSLDSITQVKLSIKLNNANIPVNAAYFRANCAHYANSYALMNYMSLLINLLNAQNNIDLSNYVEKELGKGLSTNDYTLVDKTKIEKIITTGDGSKYLGNDGQYHDAVCGGGVTTAVVPDRLSLKSISSSSLNRANRPFVCLTFDDGPESDYTTLKPYLEAKGYVGTCYIHQDGIAGRLTNAQITEMAANGWEFGSHTKDHIMFGKQAAYPVSSGNTTIDVITSGGRNWFTMGGAAELKFYFSVSSTDTRIIRVTNTQVISDTVLRLTLASVADFTTLSNREIWLHEDTVELFALPPKERLEGLGFTCNGFAYTWGAYSDLAQQVIRRNFGYARGAYGSYSGDAVDGGSFEGDFYPMDLHAVKSTELITMSSSDMDEAIADLVAKNGILVILGHTNSGQTLYNALDTFLAKVEAQKIEVTTLSKALEYTGNLAQLGNTGVAPNGDFSRGLHFAPRKSILADTQVSELPDGVIITRVNGAQAGETLPANVGTLVCIKPKSSNGFTLQMFFEFRSTRVWRRQSISLTNYTQWTRLDGFDAGVTANRPTNYINAGSTYFDTTIGKPLWYNGTNWVDSDGTIS